MTDLVTRPATLADAPAIHELVAACDRDLNGRAEITLDAVAADLARPAIDLTRDTLLLLDPAGDPVAWGWVHQGRLAEIDVRPDHRDRGLGTRLLARSEARAREVGSEWLGQNVSDADAAAGALLRAHGYEPKATAWRLEIELAAEPAPPEPPPGITVRRFRPGDGYPAYRMVEDAFNEWQQRPREYQEWAQLTIERGTFAPELSPLALDGDRLVGAVLSLDQDPDEGYVDRVAVDRAYRGRGIARLLLRHAFHDFYRLGRRRCALWTHSDTGALSLYERVGMTVGRSSTHHSHRLDGGPGHARPDRLSTPDNRQDQDDACPPTRLPSASR